MPAIHQAASFLLGTFIQVNYTMKLLVRGEKTVVQLSRALGQRTLCMMAPTAPTRCSAARLSRQQSGFLGGTMRNFGMHQQHSGAWARGFRTTTITMGVKTGIVGLPNVGKVSMQIRSCMHQGMGIN
jgi:hypothetical protein